MEKNLTDFSKQPKPETPETAGGWISVADRLPAEQETVFISNGEGFTSIGCRVWSEENWWWAESNGVVYEDKGKIVAECELDDLDVRFWHPFPDAPKFSEEPEEEISAIELEEVIPDSSVKTHFVLILYDSAYYVFTVKTLAFHSPEMQATHKHPIVSEIYREPLHTNDCGEHMSKKAEVKIEEHILEHFKKHVL